jgi:lysine-ketoglutarate reductase/saccharopine dehydrogenase-like protein (TIGR00300 family)
VQANATVEITGHLLDSGVLARVLEDVIAAGGNFQVTSMQVGSDHDDESTATISIGAADDDALARILMRVQVHGVNQVEPGHAVLRRCARDGVFPEDFYATTALETLVRLDGDWVPVEFPEAGCGLRVVDGRVHTVAVTDVAAGDHVVCGASGVSVALPPREHSAYDEHAVPLSAESQRSPRALLVRRLAQRLKEVKADGERIVWVAGPATVRMGGVPALVSLLQAGWIDALLAGNAVAVLDVAAAMSDRELGVGPGGGPEHGREEDVRTVNAVRATGSLRAAVDSGLLTRGLVHAAVEAEVPLVLVGSVRDDAPLPGVLTDVVAGQRAMRTALTGAGIVVTAASRLHAVATTALLPASVPSVSIDLDPATVATLTQRGSGAEAVGIVTDVGLFLEQLARELVRGYGASTP